MKLSENFTLSELVFSPTAIQLQIKNEPTPDQIHKLEALCKHVLQPLRNYFGKPISITSGFRSQALNKAKQGATEKEFNDAMSDAEKTRASYAKDVKNAIFKKATPTQMDEFTSQRKNSGRFDLEGMDKGYKKGGKVTASTRADGIAQRGKTKGRIC